MKTDTSAKPVPVLNTDGCCITPVPAKLNEERATLLADQLKALADPTRLRMLDLLAQQVEPLCVCDITAQFPQRQPTISHHLSILRAAGLVECEKRGVWAYYWATATGNRQLDVITGLG